MGDQQLATAGSLDDELVWGRPDLSSVITPLFDAKRDILSKNQYGWAIEDHLRSLAEVYLWGQLIEAGSRFHQSQDDALFYQQTLPLDHAPYHNDQQMLGI